MLKNTSLQQYLGRADRVLATLALNCLISLLGHCCTVITVHVWCFKVMFILRNHPTWPINQWDGHIRNQTLYYLNVTPHWGRVFLTNQSPWVLRAVNTIYLVFHPPSSSKYADIWTTCLPDVTFREGHFITLSKHLVVIIKFLLSWTYVITDVCLPLLPTSFNNHL